MTHATARPELPESQVIAQANRFLQIHVINNALRDAALAETVYDALDCCADALLHLAEIARAEVRNG